MLNYDFVIVKHLARNCKITELTIIEPFSVRRFFQNQSKNRPKAVFTLVPGRGLEPPHLTARAPKARVSTNSTIPARTASLVY
jgi:hypothetical protein